MPFELDINPQKQPNEYDCWATCASMVLKFKGHDVSVNDITQFAAEKKVQGYEKGQEASIAETIYIVKKLTEGSVTFDTIKRYDEPLSKNMDFFIDCLKASRPIIIGMPKHLMLVFGFEDANTLRVIDPAHGAKGSMTFKDLAENLVDAAVLSA